MEPRKKRSQSDDSFGALRDEKKPLVLSHKTGGRN